MLTQTDTPTQRGDVYYANLGQTYSSIGDHVQKGRRPVIILSSNAACATSDVLTIVPLSTSTKCAQYPRINPVVDTSNSLTSYALCNQIQTISRFDLYERLTHLSAKDMTEVSRAVCYALSIPLYDEDKAYINSLYEQGRFIIEELHQLIPPSCPSIAEKRVSSNNDKPKRFRRTAEEIARFLQEWSNAPTPDAREVIRQDFGFSTYSAASQFYYFHRKKKEVQQ